MDVVLLIVRVVVGGLFVGHGTQKLFGWFGGHGVDGTAGFMESLGYKPGRPAAVGAGVTESLGGVLLILGLATPLAAAMVVGTMVNAVVSAHLTNGLWATNGGYELPLVYVVTTIAIVATGPGLLSLDAAFGAEMWGGVIAITSALVGVAAGAFVLSKRVTDAGAPTLKMERAEPTGERRAA
jgi:putative oxidoreductase